MNQSQSDRAIAPGDAESNSTFDPAASNGPHDQQESLLKATLDLLHGSHTGYPRISQEKSPQQGETSSDSLPHSQLPSLTIADTSEGSLCGFARGLMQSSAHALLQQPLEGAAQVFDHTIGEAFATDLYDKSKDLLIAAPAPAAFGTAEWHGQSIGGALGMVPWFLASRTALRSMVGLTAVTRTILTTEAESAVAGQVMSAQGGKMILETGMTAATYSAFLKPVSQQQGNFWSAKTKDMAGDFATFSTMAASSVYLNSKVASLAKPLLQSGPLAAAATRWGSAAAVNTLSAVPAAAVESGSHYLQSGGKESPTAVSFVQSVYNYAIVGAALSADTMVRRGQVPAADAGTRINSEEGLSKTVKPGIITGQWTEDERRSYENGFDSAELHAETGPAKLPHEIVPTAELAKDLSVLPTGQHLDYVLFGRPVGEIPAALVSEGVSQNLAFSHLDALANALRALDGNSPPQKKFGAGAEDLALKPFTFSLGEKPITVTKAGTGEVAHVYKLSADGQDFAFKVPNDPSRFDIHGAIFETGAFAYLSKHKISDLIDFHAASPDFRSGWMLTEYVSHPVAREGTPLKDVLSESGFILGDDWSANRGPGNVVWDVGGIEPKDVNRPTNMAEFAELLNSENGQFVAGRKLEGLSSQADRKQALLDILDNYSPAVGQVGRSAVRLLKDPSDINDVLSKALHIHGAGGRAAFELDRLEGTQYITPLFHEALAEPEARLEAAKQIDKLPPAERKAAFDAAMVFPEARSMAARAIPSIEDAGERAAAVASARRYDASNYVLLEMTSRQRPLTEEEKAEQESAFANHFGNYGLSIGQKAAAETHQPSFEQWLKTNVEEPAWPATTNETEAVATIWPRLNDQQKSMPPQTIFRLAANFYKLDPHEWKTMNAEETLETLNVIRDFKLNADCAQGLFARPDLRKFLAQNSSLSERNPTVYYDLLSAWSEIPWQYKKTLSGQDLIKVAEVFGRMPDSDWSNVPAERAADLADTIKHLGLYDSDALLASQTPDFVSWFQKTTHLEHAPSYTHVLSMWNHLSADQKKLPDYQLIELSRRMEDENIIKAKFGQNSAVLPFLSGLKSGSESALSYAATWLKSTLNSQAPATDSPEGLAVIERLVADGAPLSAFEPANLNSHLLLDHYFSGHSDLKAKIQENINNPYDLSWVTTFISENPEAGKIIIAEALAHEYKGSSAERGDLQTASRLASQLDLGEDSTKYLMDMYYQGLNLHHLRRYTSQFPSRMSAVKEAIDSRASVKELDVKRMLERDNLDHLSDFDENERAKLTALCQAGLSLGRLRYQLEDSPTRLPHFKTLLRQNASVREINSFMHLSVMPPDLALKLAAADKQGQIRTESVVAALRDYTSGRYFANLLARHGSHGAPLDQKELTKLQARAGKLATTAGPRARLQASNSGLPQASNAESFINAIKGIDEKIPADKPIVLLGRDAWPLVPMMRQHGRPAQYFMWSRLQYNDKETRDQWLKEVPPGAAVIDTGFSGSIIDTIKTVDPSVTGYLMHSNNEGSYPKLMDLSDSYARVENLEQLPKLIYRSSAHNANGGAISRKHSHNSDSDASDRLDLASRWYIERQTRGLLRAAGLEPWDVWRYSQFVGLTPKERLGLSTQEQVEQHYRAISEARARAASAADKALTPTIQATGDEGSTAP